MVLTHRSPADWDILCRLQREGRIHETHDTLMHQLRDLAAIRQPRRKLSKAELAEAAAQILGGVNPRDYGRWVFYPWSGRLVHLIGREEFREVRLNRNRNKITFAEQERLLQTTVGIAGLSVGNAIARTLALEGCVRLKLADFDRLDLSNLNRLQAGVHEIGLNKAVLAARQIYELAPEAEISIFPDGITHDNLEEFLLGSPRVDVLVDECDSLDIKVLLRERARFSRIPVLMETSDRGMLDVERFDAEPNRPSFHGLVGELKAAGLRHLPMEEKVTHVLKIIGAETISARLGASLVEIERTLNTWPQLASDVTLGGASVATAVRRIVLGQPLRSGPRYVDLEGVFAQDALAGEPLPKGHMDGDAGKQNCQTAHGESADADGRSTSQPSLGISPFLAFLAEQAVLAPSGGNLQPWQFYADGEVLHMVQDRERSRSLLDVRQFASCIAMGAAIENAVIAAAHRGFTTTVEAFPSQSNPAWMATLRFAPASDEATLATAALFPFLAQRVTNRRTGDPKPLDPGEAQILTAAASLHGVAIQLQTDRGKLDDVGQILGEADRVRFLCAALHRQVMSQLRWSPKEVESTRDGIDLATMELTAAEDAALRVLARPEIAAILRSQNAGAALAEGAQKSILGACAVGMFRVNAEDAHHFLSAGRAIQRVWLNATRLGLGFQPMTALLFTVRMIEAGDRNRPSPCVRNPSFVPPSRAKANWARRAWPRTNFAHGWAQVQAVGPVVPKTGHRSIARGLTEPSYRMNGQRVKTSCGLWHTGCEQRRVDHERFQVCCPPTAQEPRLHRPPSAVVPISPASSSAWPRWRIGAPSAIRLRRTGRDRAYARARHRSQYWDTQRGPRRVVATASLSSGV